MPAPLPYDLAKGLLALVEPLQLDDHLVTPLRDVVADWPQDSDWDVEGVDTESRERLRRVVSGLLSVLGDDSAVCQPAQDLLAMLEPDTPDAPSSPRPLDPEEEAILLGFVDERSESLEELEALALELEKVDSPEALDGILRIVHSIKGDAGVLGLSDIATICHELEDGLLGKPHEVAAVMTLDTVNVIRQHIYSLLPGHAPQMEMIEEMATPRLELPTDSLDDGDEELLGEFCAEAQEHLESIDASLLILEGDDAESRGEAINSTFRAFHTIKGLAGFLNLNIVMSLAHEAEAMLHKVRSEEIALTKSVVEAAFQVNDTLKGLIGSLGEALANQKPLEAPENYHALIAQLKQAAQGEEAPQVVRRPVPKAPVSPSGNKPSKPGLGVGNTLKVDAARLDLLVDTIGELVIAEAMVSQCEEVLHSGSSRLAGLIGQLDKTTRELQEMAMSLRMVPIRSTFGRMARLARDVSNKLSKPIDFVTKGDDTEMDKTVVDVIGDPLVHMVRNAIDHGIENDPAARAAAGKPEAGQVELRAFHQGGSIHVEIEDDGGGLSREGILAKARANGIVDDDGESLSDSEVYNLIFAPGFSTASQVTEVSGRGVGLDVVRRNIEGLRGRVEIRSTPGQGTVFSIRLPLTLAIIDGMVVRVGQRRYIVPTLSIVRMFRPTESAITKVMDRGHILEVGDKQVSLARLDELFDLGVSTQGVEEMSAVVVESATGQFAFLVDELLGQQQIVIKPLGSGLKGTQGIAGGAIMPDGTVGLILDIPGLVEAATASHSTAS